MKFNREIVTPYLAVIFIVVAVSGIFMFFHLLDDFTNVVHEFLELAFATFAIPHIIKNWKSIGNYSKKKKFFLPAGIILFVSISLITIWKIEGNLENKLLERMIESPVSYSFKTLNIDYRQADSTLKQNKIFIRDSLHSIKEICIENKKSPEEVIELIFK